MGKEDRNYEESDIRWEILEHIGTLRTSSTGWSREFNLVKWNDSKPKYDIRDWAEDHDKMGKGITLTPSELRRIVEWLQARGLDKIMPEQNTAEEQPF